MKNRLLAAGAALVAVTLLQPYRLFVVNGTSMTPTFSSGQFLLAKVRPHGIERGDVVVFNHNDENMVKRVAYLPGDSIQRFWYAGEWKIPMTPKMLDGMLRLKLPRQQYVVPSGHVYVLADNPDGSIDSRILGAIPDSDLVAVVPNVDSSAEWALEGAKVGSRVFAQF